MRARNPSEDTFEEVPREEAFQLAQPVSRFAETLKQSLLALSFDIGGLLAGSILVTFSGVLSLAPWVLMIYPSILGMRGVIGVLFSGRLTTGLHLGTVRPSLRENTKSFHLLYFATVTLTLQSSLMMGLFASFLSISLWGSPLTDVSGILSVIITTMGLSLLFVSPATLGVSILAFRYGLDPDIIVYPVISTFADILVTVCFILAIGLSFYPGHVGAYVAGLSDLFFALVVLFILARYRKEREFTRTIKEFSLALAVVTIIASVTGNFLGKVSQLIGSRPDIYVVYPALIDTMGDIGSIVGSTTTTKLALGTVDPSLKSIKRNIPEISGACLSSAIWFVVFAAIAFDLTHSVFVLNELLMLVAVLLILNLLAAPLMSVISYGVAVLTYRRGLDPDNFVIPFESSLADSVTTICLFILLSLFARIGAA